MGVQNYVADAKDWSAYGVLPPLLASKWLAKYEHGRSARCRRHGCIFFSGTFACLLDNVGNLSA